jgi:hypothetical protein
LKFNLAILTFFIFLCACEAEQKGNVLAEAYGNKLYDTELNKILSTDVSFEDSVFMVKEHINVWLSKQVLLNQVPSVLSEQEQDKSKQLEQYKNDLLIYEVLNKLSMSQLDTSFTNLELEDYYNKNIDEFELSQNILKINFFKIPKESDDIDLLWSNFKANDESVNTKLIELSQEGGNYYTDKSSWVFFDDILKEIPINTYNQEHYLNNNKFIQLKDGDFLYFVKIIDFKIRSNTSPFSLEKDNIRKILLMKRQQTIIKSIETKLIKEAYSNHKVIVH